MKRNTLSRLGGLTLLLCACGVLSLHGCSQRYIDSTQRSWLVNFQPQSTVTNVVTTGSAIVSDDFVGEITTRISGRLQTPHIGELSGLAVSQNNSSLYWAINDSGNAPVLFAMDRGGRSLGEIKLPFANKDWEALSSFKDAGKSWLLIADTGDNLRRRKTHKLFVIQEPVLGSKQKPVLHREIEFVYEDGPQNTESVAVSVAERAIYLVSKEANTPKLYALPLDLAATSGDTKQQYPPVAKLVGHMQALPFTDQDRAIERLLAGRFLLGPTGMDINASDTLAVVANYRHAYLYRRAPAQSWTQALMQKPAVITSHRLAQSESLAFGLEDNSVLVGSEGMNAPLLIVQGESP